MPNKLAPRRSDAEVTDLPDDRIACGLEGVLVSDEGWFFVAGWVADDTRPLLGLQVRGTNWTRAIEGRHVGRSHSRGGEAGRAPRTAMRAFWALAVFGPDLADPDDCVVELALTGGATASGQAPVGRLGHGDFRDRVAKFVADLEPGEHHRPEDPALFQRLLEPPPATPARSVPRHTIERIAIAEGGGVFVAGWINDTAEDLAELRIDGGSWRVTLGAGGLARSGRDDVQAALELPRRHAFGFWGVVTDPSVSAAGPTCICDIVMRSGAVERHEVGVQLLFDQIELRNLALTYLATARYLGNPMLDSVACLENAIGAQIIRLNTLISRAITARPHVERFIGHHRPCKGSIIVCLYGKPEYMFLQCALFSGRPGIQDYEFVYVSNSPELAEPLLQEARLCALTYGINLTLVLLPGNAGFGAANNAAVAVSQSGRSLIVNPDVFPLDQDWAAKHSMLVEALPAGQTKLFGAPLYYDDGSLMHGGMYFDGDAAISVERASFKSTTTLRVEHFGKGAPPSASQFLVSRPVPAITGAFQSWDRAWFEKLGGFSEEYVLGHYEDADLCLTSTGQGVAPWIHNIKLWHLEGKGSARRQPAHEGASIVNRWLFNKRWVDLVSKDMLGQRPRHPLLAAASERPVDSEMIAPKGSAGKRLRPASGRPTRAGGLPALAPVGRPLARGREEIVF